jgi:RND family efflux transporter MFP subunit
MKKFVKYFLPLGLILGSIVVVIVMVGIAQGKRPERKETSGQALAVQAIRAEARSLNLSVSSQGSVAPRTQTTLVAEVSGQVVNVSPNFIAGGFFRKGETLLQIDPSDYETGLMSAQAALAARKAQLADQKARSEQALKDWRNLGRQGEPSDLVLRKPQLAEAQAAVQAAEAELRRAERNLERTNIKVPYDGLVRAKQVDVGQFVSPGTPLGVTFAIDYAEIRLPLSSADLAYLDLPSATRLDRAHRVPVELSATMHGGIQQWQAEIVRTEGVVDERSRVVYAVAQVNDPYSVLGVSDQTQLRMGTFVRARIQGQRADNVVMLPRSVLQNDNTVLVANDQRELEVRTVEVLRAEPQHVYLAGGVEDGELVVVTSLDAPIPGTKLSIVGENNPPPTAGAPAEAPAIDGAGS